MYFKMYMILCKKYFLANFHTIHHQHYPKYLQTKLYHKKKKAQLKLNFAKIYISLIVSGLKWSQETCKKKTLQIVFLWGAYAC